MSDYKKNSFDTMQTTLHLGMGCVYVIIGLLVIYVKYFGTMELSAGLAYALGGLMLAYGIFRLWRGVIGLKRKRH